jgi:hypothetical protein
MDDTYPRTRCVPKGVGFIGFQESCSSIGKNQVPQPSTDTNDIVLKMLYTIAKGMY